MTVLNFRESAESRKVHQEGPTLPHNRIEGSLRLLSKTYVRMGKLETPKEEGRSVNLLVDTTAFNIGDN